MPFEFMQAFAKFFVDKSEWDKSLAGLPADAGKAASEAEKILAATFKGGLGKAAQQVELDFGKAAGATKTGFAQAADFIAAAAKRIEDRLTAIPAKVTAAFSSGDLGKGFTKGLESGGDTLQRIGEIAGKTAAVLTNPWVAGAAAVALVGKELIEVGRASIEFDREYTKVRVLLRGTPGELAEVRNQISQVSGGLISGTEAIGVYRKALLDTGSKEAAAEIGRVAVELAKISDASPIQTVELLGGALDSTGKKFSDVENVAGKLFQLMQRGGGDVAQLSGQYLNLLDTADTLGISLEEVNALLIRLGEISGAKPEKNMTAVALAFAALSANAQKFREQGFDLEEVIKTDGLIGALRVLQAVTGGNREALRELGVAGRNSTVILKGLGDVAKDAGAALREGIRVQNEAGKSDVQAALFKRMGAASSELEKFQNQLKDLRAQAGTSLFDALGLTDDTPLAELESRLAGIIKKIEDAKGRAKTLATAAESPAAAIGGMGGLRRAGGRAADQNLADLLKQRAMFEALIDVQKRSTAATDKDSEATAKNSVTAITNAVTTAARTAAIARLAQQVELSTAALKSEALQLQARALVDARERIATEARVRGEEELQAGVTRDQQRLQSTLTTTLAIAEAERSLDQARAQIEGRESAGLEDLLALRKRVAEEGTQAELAAQDKTTASIVRSTQIRIEALREQAAEMAERPGFDANLDLRKQFEELHAQIAKSTSELDKLQQDAAAKRLVTEQRLQADLAKLRTDEFNARRAQILEEQKLDDQAFAHRLAMGRATIPEEIDRPRLLSMDPDRTADERAKFAEQARSRERTAQQEMLDFLRSINQLTLQDAIRTQQAIVDATKRGTQERMDAERKLADAIKALRAAAAGVTGSLFDLAANAGPNANVIGGMDPKRSAFVTDPKQSAFVNPQPAAFSKSDISRELEERRRQAQEAAGRFKAGGGITREELQLIQTMTNLDDQLAQFGGGLAGANAALAQFAKNLLVPFSMPLGTPGGAPGVPISPMRQQQLDQLDPELEDLRREFAGLQAEAQGAGDALAAIRRAWGSAPGGPGSPDTSGAAERAAWPGMNADAEERSGLGIERRILDVIEIEKRILDAISRVPPFQAQPGPGADGAEPRTRHSLQSRGMFDAAGALAQTPSGSAFVTDPKKSAFVTDPNDSAFVNPQQAASGAGVDKFPSGFASGLDNAISNTDFEAEGQRLAESMFRGVYDKLVATIDRESQRL